MNNIYISILTAIIAIAALVISFFNYRRSLKLQNENIIYAKKVDAYMEFSTYLWRLVNKTDEICSLVIQTPKTFNQKVEKSLDELELTESAFYDIIIKHSLISDQKISDKLFDLIELDVFLFDYDLHTAEEIKKQMTIFIDKADDIFDQMEEDLAIKHLSSSLASRIKSIPSKKARNKIVD